MSRSELAWRSLHDLGLATWFGGSVFATVAVPHEHEAHEKPSKGGNTQAAVTEQVQVDSWQRFSPVLTAAMVAHVVGGVGLIAWNRGRHRHHDGVMATTVVKSALTVAAVALTVGAELQANGRPSGTYSPTPSPSLVSSAGDSAHRTARRPRDSSEDARLQAHQSHTNTGTGGVARGRQAGPRN